MALHGIYLIQQEMMLTHQETMFLPIHHPLVYGAYLEQQYQLQILRLLHLQAVQVALAMVMEVVEV